MKWFSSRPPAAKSKKSASLTPKTACKPTVEALEDRLVPSGFYGFNIYHEYQDSPGHWVESSGVPQAPGNLVIVGSNNDNYVRITEVPYNGSTLLRIDYAPWHFDQAHPGGFTIKSELHTLLYDENMVLSVYYFGGNGRDYFQNQSTTVTWAWGDREHTGNDDPIEPTFGGDDVLIGGLGPNHLFGGGGNDLLVSNTIYAPLNPMFLSHFDAEIHPPELNVYNDDSYIAELYGQGGDDILIASHTGHTYLSGGSGDDRLLGGGGGSNLLFGGLGDDILDPGIEDPSNFNDNVMFGYFGADTFVVRTTYDFVADLHHEGISDGDRIVEPRFAFLFTMSPRNVIHTIGLASDTQGNFSGDQLAGLMPLDVVAAADQTALGQPIDVSMADVLAAIDMTGDSDQSDVIDVGQLINAAIGDRAETIDASADTAPYVNAPADIVQLVTGLVDAPAQDGPGQPNLVTTDTNVIDAALNNADSAPVAGSMDLALTEVNTGQTAADILSEVSNTGAVDPSAAQNTTVAVSDAALGLAADASTQDAPIALQPTVVATEANAVTAALNDAASAPIAGPVDPALSQVDAVQTADLLNQASNTDSVDPLAVAVVSEAALGQVVDAPAPVNIVTTEPDIVTAAPPVSQQPTGTIIGGTSYLGLGTTSSSVLSTYALDSFFTAPVSYRVSYFAW